jgi:membrane-bound ClpP family serine protease
VTTGTAGMVSERGQARVAFGPGSGRVDLRGEIWNAVADVAVAAGDIVEVLEVRGLTVYVRPLPGVATAVADEAVAPGVTAGSGEHGAKAVT